MNLFGTELFKIRTYEAGEDGEARFASMCNLLQEIASRHADQIDLGFDAMLERGVFWALVRLSVRISRYPRFAETLTVRTWPKGTDGPFALRDFAVEDRSGKRILAATSGWIVVDTESRRLRRPDDVLESIHEMPTEAAIEGTAPKVGRMKDVVPGKLFAVSPEDIDPQGHVNSIRYIAWMENEYVAWAAGTKIGGIDINFTSEAMAGSALRCDVSTDRSKMQIVEGDRYKTVLARATILPFVVPEDERVDEKGENQEKEQISTGSIAIAEAIAGIEFTEDERRQIVETIPRFFGSYRSRRSIRFPNQTAPFEPRSLVDRAVPRADAKKAPPTANPHSGPTQTIRAPLSGVDLAFASLGYLGSLLNSRHISSRELTELYLDRLRKHDDTLECVVTLTEERAYEEADIADRRLSEGTNTTSLTGIPWGAKDLLDTAGIRTSWGATPYRERVPTEDAAVVSRLSEAGAVLVAKLSLGALAMGDTWFGGLTRNPWKPSEGSSGSSAGSAAATAAGLVGFGIGSETMGSIVSPSLTCGAVGLRPTFGRVPKNGAMTLSWTFDKLGPICRCVGDAALVLEAISGYDPRDPYSIPSTFSASSNHSIEGLRIGFDPVWFETDPPEIGSTSMRGIRQLASEGANLVEISLPDLPYQSIMRIIEVDAAAAFEELTLDHRDDELVRQENNSWPNTFRAARFIPAIEYVQAQRLRSNLQDLMDETYKSVDVIANPEFEGPLLMIGNATGLPSLTLPSGFRDDTTPFGINLLGRPFDEALLCRVGSRLERIYSVVGRIPGEFS